jgi:hypothetical protein
LKIQIFIQDKALSQLSLDGHAYGSWRGKGNLGRMWLRDFLSKDLPQCRTMIYGYNSKLTTHGTDTILDFGRGLMEELKKIRNSEKVSFISLKQSNIAKHCQLRERPLIFIAHSFGGIILAHVCLSHLRNRFMKLKIRKCLIQAVQATSLAEPASDHLIMTTLHRATYGMLLFGIPHQGLVVDDFQQILSKDSNHARDTLLKEIQSKSQVLAYQLAAFKNLIGDRKVVSFYETGQTKRLQFV